MRADRFALFGALVTLAACNIAGEAPAYVTSQDRAALADGIVIVESDPLIVPPGETRGMAARCPRGTTSLAGGVRSTGALSKLTSLDIRRPPLPAVSSVLAFVRNDTEVADEVVVQAVCGPDGFELVESEPLIVPPGENVAFPFTSFAYCPGDTVPVGVGARFPQGAPATTTLQDLDAHTDGAAPPRVRATFTRSSEASGDTVLIVQAVCAPTKMVEIVETVVEVPSGTTQTVKVVCESTRVGVGAGAGGAMTIQDLAHDNGGSDYVTMSNLEIFPVLATAQALCLR